MTASVPGGLPTVDVQDLAGDERGPFEIQDAVDDVADLAHPAEGVERRPGPRTTQASCSGVLMTPGATALTRTPRDAYSIASERVTAASPPLVSDASAEGSLLSAWSTRLVVMLTTWPLPWATICPITRWVMWKNPARFTAVIAEKSSGVYSVNGLPMKIPAVVDQAVDPTEPIERLLHHALARSRRRVMSPSTVRKSGSSDGGHRARGAHDRVAGAAERRGQPGADAPRGAGDDRDLLRLGAGAHATR